MADNEINIVVTATDKASSALNGVKGSIITLNQGLQLAQQAFGMVKKVVEESIGAYVKYADQVRRLSQLNGTTAEETSRLIQVTDDHKVSVEALTMATRKLSQQGLSLTIDSLAKMSDEYLSLGSSSEKTRFLLDKFGRSGLQFAETMEQGSSAIRGESAAISQNLILTQKQLVAARDYEKQLDQLNDTVMGLKVAIGAELMPVMLGAVKAVQTSIPYWADMGRQLGVMADFLTQSTNPALRAFGAYMEWIQGLIGMGKTDVDSATKSWIDMGNALALAAEQGAGLPGTLEDSAAAATDLSGQLSSILSFGQNYRQSQEDMKTLEEELADARKRGYSETGTKILEIKGRIEEAKASQTEWTNKFILDMAMMQAAADGLTPDEAQGLMAMAVQLGIIDEKAIEAYDYLMKINGLDVSGSATITTTYINIGQGGSYSGSVQTPGGSTRRASGGSIPAGGMAWVGDSPSGLTPHSELVYAPHGAQVFNSNQSRSMGAGGSPRAFTGGMIPGSSGEMTLSSETIRQLASSIANEVRRANG